jgi:nitrogen fixation protein FixH
MMDNRVEQSEKPITGFHVLAAMVCFFGVIIAVNLTMAYFAGASWTGLEVKNSYVASQDYNKKLAAVERQRALGWTSRLTVADQRVVLELTDANSDAIVGAEVEAQLKRPVQESADVALDFVESRLGVYSAQLPPRIGLWDVDFTVKVHSGETYRRIVRVHLKD